MQMSTAAASGPSVIGKRQNILNPTMHLRCPSHANANAYVSHIAVNEDDSLADYFRGSKKSDDRGEMMLSRTVYK